MVSHNGSDGADQVQAGADIPNLANGTLSFVWHRAGKPAMRFKLTLAPIDLTPASLTTHSRRCLG